MNTNLHPLRLVRAAQFGFNAGSAFEASSRAVGALLATQVAACVGAFVWGLCEYMQHGKFGVLGMATGESLAHLNHLVARGEAVREPGADGATRYRLQA